MFSNRSRPHREMKPYQLGLVGHPLTHSVSPAIHRMALAAAGLDGEYRLHPVPPPPEGLAEMERLLAGMRMGEIDGLNVTIPHKQNIIPYLDRLDPAARAVGAVNTISPEDGRLVGRNTDIGGFRRDLARTLAPAPGRALVLGAGGAARAVTYALLKDGWVVSVAARQLEQARELVRQLAGIGEVLPLPLPAGGVEALQPTLIVNTTPLGMAPHTAGSPWPADRPFPPGSAAYDLVYNPRQTAFLEAARAQGIPFAGGVGMLVEQAALAFQTWTGVLPPFDPLMEAAGEALMTMRKDRS